MTLNKFEDCIEKLKLELNIESFNSSNSIYSTYSFKLNNNVSTILLRTYAARVEIYRPDFEDLQDCINYTYKKGKNRNDSMEDMTTNILDKAYYAEKYSYTELSAEFVSTLLKKITDEWSAAYLLVVKQLMILKMKNI